MINKAWNLFERCW